VLQLTLRATTQPPEAASAAQAAAPPSRAASAAEQLATQYLRRPQFRLEPSRLKAAVEALGAAGNSLAAVCLAAEQADSHAEVDAACALFGEVVSAALAAAGMRQAGGRQGASSSQRTRRALPRAVARQHGVPEARRVLHSNRHGEGQAAARLGVKAACRKAHRGWKWQLGSGLEALASSDSAKFFLRFRGPRAQLPATIPGPAIVQHYEGLLAPYPPPPPCPPLPPRPPAHQQRRQQTVALQQQQQADAPQQQQQPADAPQQQQQQAAAPQQRQAAAPQQ